MQKSKRMLTDIKTGNTELLDKATQQVQQRLPQQQQQSRKPSPTTESSNGTKPYLPILRSGTKTEMIESEVTVGGDHKHPTR